MRIKDFLKGGFTKKFEFLELFRSTNLSFRALTEHCKDSILMKSSAAQAKKKFKNAVFGHFLEFFIN